MDNNIKDRILGCLYGQAIGDALGLGTEFMSKGDVKNHYPEKLTCYSQIVQDRHRSRWEKGAWTDDTDMMLCILRAFNGERFDINKVAYNFKEWYNTYPLGIGASTANVLSLGDYTDNPRKAAEIFWNLSGKNSAPNGAIMRTSVIGLEKSGYKEDAIDICKLTHYDPRCVGSCVIAVEIIHNLVWENKTLSLDEIVSIGDQYDARIKEWVELAFRGSLSALRLDDSRTMGYTLRTLAAALWCYFHSRSFMEGLIDIVNEGGDADTNAAISGAILGAKYGYNSIPDKMIKDLHNESLYNSYVKNFVKSIL